MHRSSDTSTEGTLVPIGQAALLLGVSVDTIRRWEADGKITGHRTLGGQRRFSRAEIDRILSGREGVPS